MKIKTKGLTREERYKLINSIIENMHPYDFNSLCNFCEVYCPECEKYMRNGHINGFIKRLQSWWNYNPNMKKGAIPNVWDIIDGKLYNRYGDFYEVRPWWEHATPEGTPPGRGVKTPESKRYSEIMTAIQNMHPKDGDSFLKFCHVYKPEWLEGLSDDAWTYFRCRITYWKPTTLPYKEHEWVFSESGKLVYKDTGKEVIPWWKAEDAAEEAKE